MAEKQHIDTVRAQLKAGNNDYLQYVYNKYRKFCQDYLEKKKGCPTEDAEDIFMDALLVLRENILKSKMLYLEGIQNYMLTVCLNTYRERVRAQIRKSEEGMYVKELFYESQKNEEATEHYQQTVAITLQALSQLGESCRQIIRYYYIDHLSMSDIAEEMKWKSPEVAKTTKSRCLKQWIEMIKRLNEAKEEKLESDDTPS